MAAVQNLNVSIQDLRTMSNNFGAKASDVQNYTKQMLALVDGVKGSWKSGAADEYYSKFEALQNDMDRIFKMIYEYRQDLDEIARQYESTEEANKQAAANLTSSVTG